MQHHAEREDIGALVHPATRLTKHRQVMLGGHVGKRSSHGSRYAGAIERDVEIGEHRPTVARDENVRGLDVAVEDAAHMREGQRIGQPAANPADRLGEVIGPQGVAVAKRRRVEAGLPLRGGIESGEDRASPDSGGWPPSWMAWMTVPRSVPATYCKQSPRAPVSASRNAEKTLTM